MTPATTQITLQGTSLTCTDEIRTYNARRHGDLLFWNTTTDRTDAVS